MQIKQLDKACKQIQDNKYIVSSTKLLLPFLKLRRFIHFLSCTKKIRMLVARDS